MKLVQEHLGQKFEITLETLNLANLEDSFNICGVNLESIIKFKNE